MLCTCVLLSCCFARLHNTACAEIQCLHIYSVVLPLTVCFASNKAKQSAFSWLEHCCRYKRVHLSCINECYKVSCSIVSATLVRVSIRAIGHCFSSSMLICIIIHVTPSESQHAPNCCDQPSIDQASRLGHQSCLT